MLTAALGQFAILWRTAPIATELEGVSSGWLRQALGPPDVFDGLITDTASTSSLIALAAAREAAGVDAAARGIGGRPDVRLMRMYASAEAHSSIEKACMTLGFGRDALVKIPTNDRFELRPAGIGRPRHRPIAIVATVGTTSWTSVDPVAALAALADIAAAEGIWLHVDAAYAGAVANDMAARPAIHGFVGDPNNTLTTGGPNPETLYHGCLVHAGGY
jgi:aromatic-L-amino-acid decarboxylase